MSKFAPIHIISGYSLLESGLTMKRINSAIKDNDYFGVGLTDSFLLSGLPPFAHICVDNKKPYILGSSIEIEDNYFAIYAMNEDGYKNLSFISCAHQDNRLTFDFLREHSEGLIGVLETYRGKFYQDFNALEKVDTAFTKYLLDISKIFGDYFYLGIEVTSRDDIKYAKKVREFAKEYTYECVALPRILYLKKEDAIILDIVNAIRNNETLDKKEAVGQHYFMKEADYHKIYTEDEILNTNKIVLSNKLDFFKKRGTMLHYDCEDSDVTLREMAYASLSKLGLDNDEKYVNRINYELDVIKSMGYSDYFLLVQDYVNWAKNNDILVGPGRGSAAGALISYLLNITEVDPLKFGLQFERFLNPNRSTMPDIDVDFIDTKRNDVVQYMRDKYGYYKVAVITTFQTIGAKQSLRDIGRIYQVNEDHIKKLCNAIGNDDLTLGQAYHHIEAFKKLCEDAYLREIVSMASKIEGLPRQTSVHAAGIILNNVSMIEAMPISVDLNDNYVTQYEAKYLEEQGFLKMDFLNLRNITTVDYCVNLINSHYPDLHLDKYNIPYDTEEVFDLIRSGQVIGLFQIETATMRKGIQIIQPKCFDDVVALLALNRPGPMDYLPNYAKRRDGKEKITYLSEDLKDILAPTYGIIVYQEQINQIATKIAGMTPGESDLFRRAVSKKDSAVLKSSKERFVKGCIANGYSEKNAIEIFNHIAKFADYGFNKSHSVAYAVLTCRMAYLKANYPLEFYSAILETGSTSETKFGEYILEMKKRNIKVLPPSINNSTLTYNVHNDSLLFPLTAIKGINIQCASNIVNERNKGEFKDFFNFVSRMFPYQINEKQIMTLIDSGALDDLYHSRASMRITVKAALQYAELSYSADGNMSLGISPLNPPRMNVEEDRPLDNLDYEYEVLGIMLSSNPLDYKKAQLDKCGVKTSLNDLTHYGLTKAAGIIKAVKILKTKKGEQMAVLNIIDQTGELRVTVFPRIFDTVKGYLIKNNIVVIDGRFDRSDETTFIADNVTMLGDE